MVPERQLTRDDAELVGRMLAEWSGPGWPDAETELMYRRAMRSPSAEMLLAGRPFHAHEVLEAFWKAAPPAERDFWQGLAQLAVGLTHARRGPPGR